MVLTAGTAHADDVDKIVTKGFGGYASWIENGDTLRVCDDEANGKGTRAYIYLPEYEYAENGRVLIKVSDPKADGNCVAVSKDIGETTTIALKVRGYHGATIDYCDYTIIGR